MEELLFYKEYETFYDMANRSSAFHKYCQDAFGWDYSHNAINAAKMDSERSEFRVGRIGEIDYPAGKFDMVISMDSIYFAEDMVSFVSQIFRWLKPDGIFFVGYQEGDVMAKTENCEKTVLAEALQKNQLNYQVFDITEETYGLLKRKRECAMKHKQEFENEGLFEWYAMLIGQTDCVKVSLEEYRQKNARYIYVVRNCLK